jgi:hypothetical protein
MTINEIIIATTFGVCLVGVFAGVWSIIKTRIDRYKYNDFFVRDCTNCKYGDDWQKGTNFILSPVMCGSGYQHRYVRFTVTNIDLLTHINWNIVDKDGSQIDCGKWEER